MGDTPYQCNRCEMPLDRPDFADALPESDCNTLAPVRKQLENSSQGAPLVRFLQTAHL